MSMCQPKNNNKHTSRLWKLFILMSVGHGLLQLDDNQPIFVFERKVVFSGILTSVHHLPSFVC